MVTDNVGSLTKILIYHCIDSALMLSHSHTVVQQVLFLIAFLLVNCSLLDVHRPCPQSFGTIDHMLRRAFDFCYSAEKPPFESVQIDEIVTKCL